MPPQLEARLGRIPVRLKPPAGFATRDEDNFRLYADDRRESPLAFAESVVAGLSDEPRWLDSRYLYDTAGSAIFDEITRTPEYYQTRTEEALLAAHARALRALTGDVALAELGSGSSAKTCHLLDAWTAAGPSRYLPIDVSAAPLVTACRTLAARYPSLTIEAIAASYERALPLLTGASPMLVAFLGSSLGNLGRQAEEDFLSRVWQHLSPGDYFLVGLDFAKEAAPLEAAYDDADGVTARFTRNLFVRMNRELGTQIPIDAVKHVAYYNEARERIEIFAEFTAPVTVEIPALGQKFRIARGERIRTELARKYRPDAITAAIERHGFRRTFRADDDAHGFGIFVFQRLGAKRGRPRSEPTNRDEMDELAVLTAVRERTNALIAPLDETALTARPNALMSPIVWDLGHIAHFEATWLLGKTDPRLDPLYDPLRTPRAARDRLPLPSVAETRAYLTEIRAAVMAQAGRAEVRQQLGDGRYIRCLVAEHEAQHQETILQALGLREELAFCPDFLTSASPAAPLLPCNDSVLVPSGPFVMGTDDFDWAYDNERPAHEVDLPAFRMDVAPVTNNQYLAFMNDGGYLRRELWSEAGWRWAKDTGANAPGHWRFHEGRWQAVVFGERLPLDPNAPVVHVSWFEADAYARWAQKRLPTEAEWEKAAAWELGGQRSRRFPWGDDAGDARHANLGQRRLEPAAVGTFPAGRSAFGCHQMLGDVWEWTSSWLTGYPGFRSFPYREYSEIFFGSTYRVLRGGSFATAPIVARNTFRNWDFPERRQIFAGFRCAADV
jgi:gamma-glutamyl hercynylcysteine S-oxide synthase